jgi:hypothetical protein
VNQWGYKNLTNWALIEEGALTGSGLNEIHATATTKKQMQAIAELLDMKPAARNWYRIVKIEDIPRKAVPDLAKAWDEGAEAAIQREHTYGAEEKAKYSNPYVSQT